MWKAISRRRRIGGTRGKREGKKEDRSGIGKGKRRGK